MPLTLELRNEDNKTLEHDHLLKLVLLVGYYYNINIAPVCSFPLFAFT